MSAENKGVYFTELKLQNVRCFGEEAVLKLCNDKGEWSKWNVILGDNGTGKTTLLQCLASIEDAMNSKIYRWEWKDNTSIVAKVADENNDTFSNLIAETSNGVIHFKTDRKRIIPAVKEELSWQNILVLAYGANRRISFQILSENEIFPHNSATLFDDDAKLINAEEWLLQMEFAASRESEIKEQARKRSDLIQDVLKKILHEVDGIRFANSTNIEKPVPRLEFKTPYGWVGIKELSYGYKTMVAWVVDVAARMFRQYPNEPNPLTMPVVILVDEIDLHLHPKWQRDIFYYLEEIFPRAQFIVTAHSPLIVQSAPKDANIIVLKKEKVGDEYVVRIDNDKNYVRNWRVDQILASDLFDEIGVRNKDIELQMQERRILLRKKDLSTSEKQRLDELNEIAYSMPSAENVLDIKAMEIIREAADYLKANKKTA
jgi:predicted ATP-binding protein involved in virulence